MALRGSVLSVLVVAACTFGGGANTGNANGLGESSGGTTGGVGGTAVSTGGQGGASQTAGSADGTSADGTSAGATTQSSVGDTTGVGATSAGESTGRGVNTDGSDTSASSSEGSSAGGDPPCMSDDDCDGTAPACDIVTGQCVGCLDDDDCEDPMPACDVPTQGCVECNAMQPCAWGAACQNGSCPVVTYGQECERDDECTGLETCCDVMQCEGACHIPCGGPGGGGCPDGTTCAHDFCLIDCEADDAFCHSVYPGSECLHSGELCESPPG